MQEIGLQNSKLQVVGEIKIDCYIMMILFLAYGIFFMRLLIAQYFMSFLKGRPRVHDPPSKFFFFPNKFVGKKFHNIFS